DAGAGEWHERNRDHLLEGEHDERPQLQIVAAVAVEVAAVETGGEVDAAAQPQAELTGAGDEPGDVGGELVAARRAIGEAGLEPDRMEPDLQLAGEYLGSFGLNLRLRGR